MENLLITVLGATSVRDSMLQAGKSWVPFPLALGPTQSLIEISTRNAPEVKELQEREADNLTAISKPIIYVGASTSQIFRASMACYR
jgi:hypothetical protein